MEWFDIYDEVSAAVADFVARHNKIPAEVAVSTSLYSWMAAMQRESAELSGLPGSETVVADTPFGAIPVVIDEALGPFDIMPG
ncbi:MAG: hypothetical protein D8M52_07760 [Chlorobi bacterium]|nr:MAG: hypothetical protein F9K28_07095 [Bacteroidota bacterium]KXK34884.1 MAG: hypothetical protein UZ06_CHB003000921 [Chlorobi bacterium OLB6]MBE2264933.1 hypothetical protein [Flavobacteriales bacterium]MBL1161598.1 hypothetical protein [Chlorobiota bacterium]MBW7854181.1 hypothetical protein [Candidatus Kapabacteria bacterium]MCC6332230.1 hypothetical protein [Ignavibacteria bacterium]